MSIFINLSVIFWSLFPALMSYTQPSSTPLKVELRQLVANSDLLIPKASPNENQPDGFGLQGTPLNISLVNGIWSYETNGGFVGVKYSYNFIVGNKYYIFGKGKTTLSGINLYVEYAKRVAVPVGDTMQFFSNIITVGASASNLYVLDTRAVSSPTNSTSIDYIGAINITDLVSLGLLPGGLSDLEYKTLIDNILVEIGGTFQGSYFYTETIADNYKWFSTGFVEKTGERDFIDYFGFFVWLSFPYLFAFLIYKLLKGVIYG